MKLDITERWQHCTQRVWMSKAVGKSNIMLRTWLVLDEGKSIVRAGLILEYYKIQFKTLTKVQLGILPKQLQWLGNIYIWTCLEIFWTGLALKIRFASLNHRRPRGQSADLGKEGWNDSFHFGVSKVKVLGKMCGGMTGRVGTWATVTIT